MVELVKQSTLIMIGDSSLSSKRLEAAISKCSSAGFTVALYAEALSAAQLSHRERTYQGLRDIDISAFDVLIIPDGLGNPSRQHYDRLAVDAVRHFLVSGKRIVLFDCSASPSTELVSASN